MSSEDPFDRSVERRVRKVIRFPLFPYLSVVLAVVISAFMPTAFGQDWRLPAVFAAFSATVATWAFSLARENAVNAACRLVAAAEFEKQKVEAAIKRAPYHAA